MGTDFDKWYEENETRFHHAHMDTKAIAEAAWDEADRQSQKTVKELEDLLLDSHKQFAKLDQRILDAIPIVEQLTKVFKEE